MKADTKSTFFITLTSDSFSGDEQFKNFTQTLESSVFPQCEVRKYQSSKITSRELSEETMGEGQKSKFQQKITTTKFTCIMTSYNAKRESEKLT